ncbi:hypothetical protein [Niveibacterium sp.]|uniref:hypothetical protein n=1 Tax=Niveibacterium sp. TaxID=2017444 RepID=UPI0035AEBDDC
MKAIPIRSNSRKVLLVMASALVLLGALSWTLAHAADDTCLVEADAEHDRLLIVLHNNGAELAVPRLPVVPLAH